MAKKQFEGFNSPVQFGGVSIGENTARLGVNIDRKQIHLNMADSLFCNRRLTGKVVLGLFDEANNGNETQTKLIEDTDHEVAGSFDVKGFRCSSEAVAIGATFSLKDIDIAELAKFSSGRGRLVIDQAGEIPEPLKPEPPVRSNGHVPGTLKSNGPWRKVNLDELFEPGKMIRLSLADAGINTVGQLADYSATDKRLTDIDGIGPGKAQDIEDRMLEFWADNPEAGNEAPLAK